MHLSISLIDLVNMALAGTAVGLSVVAVYVGRHQHKLQAYLQLQQFLFADDIQHGRQLLYEATRRGTLPSDAAEFALIVRALGNFNAAAALANRKIIPKHWLLDFWHHGLRDMRMGYHSVVAYRMRNWQDWIPFPDLNDLIEDAVRYRSRAVCCDDGRWKHMDLTSSALLAGGPATHPPASS